MYQIILNKIKKMENIPNKSYTKETQAFLSYDAAKDINEASEWMLNFTIIFYLLLLLFFDVTLVSIFGSSGNTLLSIIILLVNFLISSAAVYNLSKACKEYKIFKIRSSKKCCLKQELNFKINSGDS